MIHPNTPPLILIVDDEPEICSVLSKALAMAGYETETAGDGANALAVSSQRQVSLLLTDYSMPGMKGDELQREMRAIDPILSVMMMTAESDIHLAINMLKEGVSDYITKPFSLKDVCARVEKALSQRQILIEREELRRENAEYQSGLEAKVNEQSKRLLQTHRASLLALNRALEAKDETTRNHSERVSAVSTEIARVLAPNDQKFIEDVAEAALLHDIGKIGVRETVLQKLGPLTADEFEEVKRHCLIGEQILRPIWYGDRKLPIVRSHHERWDGYGYPDGLKGDEAPIGARIVAVADTWDALTSNRPYRSAQGAKEAIEVLRDGRGVQWDPEIVDAALSILGQSSSSLFNRLAA
ncbi:MAG: response regulator [Fimbriimonadaceae bacterium]|nr:response regulator [Fimbriimonadaceae bacterium]